MADLTAPTQVSLTDNTVTDKVKLDAGKSLFDVVYYDNSSQTWKSADANLSEAAAGKDGIAIVLHPSTSYSVGDNWGTVIKSGTVHINQAVTDGGIYIVSATAGKIAPDADAVSGWFKTILAVGGDQVESGIYEFIIKPFVSGQQV